ncbi:MAG: hypothetical protein WCV63_09750 [Negativicutes bacterium]|jgi:hypothetical protein
MAATETPQSKSLVCVTSYTNDAGKVAHRRSIFANLKIDATPVSIQAAGSAIFALKDEAMFELGTIVENKIVNE